MTKRAKYSFDEGDNPSNGWLRDFWAGSVSESVLNDYRSGNITHAVNGLIVRRRRGDEYVDSGYGNFIVEDPSGAVIARPTLKRALATARQSVRVR